MKNANILTIIQTNSSRGVYLNEDQDVGYDDCQHLDPHPEYFGSQKCRDHEKYFLLDHHPDQFCSQINEAFDHKEASFFSLIQTNLSANIAWNLIQKTPLSCKELFKFLALEFVAACIKILAKNYKLHGKFNYLLVEHMYGKCFIKGKM